MEIAKLTAVIDANTSGFTRAMSGVDGDLRRTSRHMDDIDGSIGRNRSGMVGLGGAARTAGVGLAFAGAAGVAAIGIGLGIAIKTGIGELADYQKNVSATNAGLKSTGGVAKVTRKDIERLSASIEAKTGIDGDQVHAAQNMLLTFTKVRKEVGKGNDIFARATTAATDLSVRGFGSVESSTKMLGKALNDPVKGISALSRAGVTFTAGQKDSIKAMVESGNILGAQKAIMKEVETQVGGSAEAYGKTLPGAVDRLKRGFEAMSMSITEALAPALTTIIEWALKNMPVFQAAVNNAISAVRPYLDAFGKIISSVFDGSTASGKKVSSAFADIKAAIASAAPAFTTIGAVAMKLAPILGQYLGAAIAAIGKITKEVMPVVANAFAEILPPVARLSAVMLKFGALFLNVLGVIIPPLVRTLAPIFAVAFHAIGQIINAIAALLEGDFSGAFSSAVAAVKAIFITLPMMIQTQMLKAVVFAATAAAELGGKIISGIGNAIASGAGKIGSAISTAIREAITNVDIPGFSPPEHAAAQAIGDPLARGVMLGFLAGTATLSDKVSDRLKAALERGKAAIESQKGTLQTAFGRLGAGILKAFDAETSAAVKRLQKRLSDASSAASAGFDIRVAGVTASGAALTPAEAELKAMRDAYSKQQNEQTRAAAIADLAAAESTGTAKEIADARKRIAELDYADSIAALELKAETERSLRDQDTQSKLASIESERTATLAALQATYDAEQLQYESARDVARQNREDELAKLGTFLESRNKTFAQKQNALNAFLGGKSVKDAMANSGTNLGNAFATALENTKGRVTAAVKTLGKLVKDYLKLNSPAKKGPLSTLDTWWTAMPETLVGGIDATMIGQVAAGISSPSGGGGMSGGGGATTIINVTVQGTVTSERELVSTIRSELLRTGQRNGSIFGGYA